MVSGESRTVVVFGLVFIVFSCCVLVGWFVGVEGPAGPAPERRTLRVSLSGEMLPDESESGEDGSIILVPQIELTVKPDQSIAVHGDACVVRTLQVHPHACGIDVGAVDAAAVGVDQMGDANRSDTVVGRSVDHGDGGEGVGEVGAGELIDGNLAEESGPSRNRGRCGGGGGGGGHCGPFRLVGAGRSGAPLTRSPYSHLGRPDTPLGRFLRLS